MGCLVDRSQQPCSTVYRRSHCESEELHTFHPYMQDFKFALLGMPEEVRRSHFLEIQARHAEGKVALACRWVARVLGK